MNVTDACHNFVSWSYTRLINESQSNQVLFSLKNAHFGQIAYCFIIMEMNKKNLEYLVSCNCHLLNILLAPEFDFQYNSHKQPRFFYIKRYILYSQDIHLWVSMDNRWFPCLLWKKQFSESGIRNCFSMSMVCLLWFTEIFNPLWARVQLCRLRAITW